MKNKYIFTPLLPTALFLFTFSAAFSQAWTPKANQALGRVHGVGFSGLQKN